MFQLLVHLYINVVSILYLILIYLENANGIDLYSTPDDVCMPNPPRPLKPEMNAAFQSCKLDFQRGMTRGHPDKNKKTGEILSSYGYPNKMYKVTSKDGYILTVFRIKGSPNLPKEQYKTRKQAVYLMHGLTLSCDCWFFQPGSKNLPFKLADAGYEVWLGCARGTTYSLGHKTLNYKTDIQYWDFSWHEMGVYDLPAVTNKILRVTGNKKIFFVGHSMGSTQYFAGISDVPELNKKIQAGFMLTPQIYMGHTNNPARAAMPLVDTHEKYTFFNNLFGGRLQSSNDYKRVGIDTSTKCEVSAAICGACENVLFSLFGYNAPHLNSSQIPLIFAKVPNTYPLKSMAHYAQITRTCSFRHYDYGEFGNLQMYGQMTPPDYNLKNIKTPLYFFHSDRDNFAQPNDVNITASKLKPGVLKGQYYIQNEYFNHVDYAFAKDADVLVYNHILEILQEYK